MGNTVVVVAPFTAERTDMRAWEDLHHRLQRATDGAVTMVWLYLSREELLQRMRARLADRDASKPGRATIRRSTRLRTACRPAHSDPRCRFSRSDCALDRHPKADFALPSTA